MSSAESETNAVVPPGTLQHRRPFRPDIQGLRAIAVVLVVLDHVFKWPSGGFVGVDVFYVISGFLITSLLLREARTTGTVSFRAFYARRAKRIVPAALVVVAATAVAAQILWFTPRAVQVLLDAFAALSFTENWHLIAGGVDYLQSSDAVSPLQHYWSLSVEEQFYALWPIILLLLMRIVPSLAKTRRLPLVIGIGIILSLAYAAYRTHSSPAAAYFDTGARGWELLVGALIATTGTSRGRQLLRQILAGFGLLLLMATAILANTSSAFPWPWAVPVVAGSGLVIWAAGSGPLIAPLTNRVAQYLGKISYSLYLWHFPVIVFVQSVTNSLGADLLALVCIFGLSALSHRCIEQPILRNKWFTTWLNDRPGITGWRTVTPAAVVVIALIAMTAVQTNGPAVLKNSAALLAAAGAQGALNVPSLSSEPTSAQLSAQIAASVQRPRMTPGLRTALDNDDERQLAPSMSVSAPGCRNSVGSPPLICSYGSTKASHTVLVVGDSVALSWVPTIESIYLPRGWQVKALGYASCSISDVAMMPRVRYSSFPAQCAAARTTMLRYATQLKPNLIVMSGDEGAYDRLVDNSKGIVAQREWARGTANSVRAFASATSQVVVLSNPPVGADPRSCMTRYTTITACASPLDGQFRSMSEAVNIGVDAAGVNAIYIDARSLFCWHDVCPISIGDTVIRADIAHITNSAAVHVARALAEQMP